MKPDIHPVNHDVKLSCSCGANYETTSTSKGYQLDICSACHPFFTGKSRIVDREGRVERFRAKYAKKKKA